MRKLLLLTCFACIMTCTNLDAAIVINVGNHTLQANTAGQQLDILISGDANDSMLSGMNLRVTIGDGLGAGLEPVFNGAEGTTDGIDLTGSVFAGSTPSGEGPVTGAPMLVNAGVTTTSNVSPNGVLVSLIVDTTGFSVHGASYDLLLSNVLGNTELLGPIGNAGPISGVVINDGSITISNVPEPGSATMFLAFACFAAMTTRSRCRARD